MNRIAFATLMSFALALAACGGEDSAPEPVLAPSTPPPGGETPPATSETREEVCVNFTYDQTPASVASTLDAVAQSFQSAPNCHLPENRNAPACQQVTVTFTPAQPWCKSRGRRILVMDNGMTFPALTRYRQRILGAYRIDQESGVYSAYTPQATLSRGLIETVGDRLGGSSTFIAAKQLNGVARNMQKFPFPSAHGDPQLANLANLTPYAQFVLADIDNASLDAFCGRRIGAAFFENVAQSIVAIVRRHGIDYINMASGTNLSTLKQAWDRSCGGGSSSPAIQPYLKAIQAAKIEALRRITQETGVVIAQSALYAPHEVDPADVEFAGDCQVVRNRLRISYVARADTGFAADGTYLGSDTSFLFDRGKAKSCTDLYVGLDWEDNFGPVGSAPLDVTYLGIGAGPQMTMDTSQSSALGLSYLLFRSQRSRDYPAMLQNAVFSSGSPLLFNPMAHRQFELCELPGRLCEL